SSAVRFTGSGGQLEIFGSSMPRATISGFVSGDTIDLASDPFGSTGSATLTSGNVLQVTGGATTYSLNLDPGQSFTGAQFHLAGDGNGGTLITVDAAPEVSPVVLNDFSWAQGWGSTNNPRIVTDVNGDGNSDYVGFGY